MNWTSMVPVCESWKPCACASRISTSIAGKIRCVMARASRIEKHFPYSIFHLRFVIDEREKTPMISGKELRAKSQGQERSRSAVERIKEAGRMPANRRHGCRRSIVTRAVVRTAFIQPLTDGY